MLSRKFYDWATAILVVVIIAGLIIFPIIIKNSMQVTGENPILGAENMFANISYLNLVWDIIGFIYYIFVLILAIQLLFRKEISALEGVCVAVFIPFAFIFYLVSLRKYID